ncbi:MAG: cyclophilin-like family protein [Candidatus Sigynarchaeota archaeon]
MDYFLIENKKIGKVKIRLYKDKAPRTIEKIEKSLPLDLDLSRWGDELYGAIPVEAEPENPQEECEIGEVAYWLDGPAFCILFGRTPASRGPKPRLISPGNVFGKIEGDPSIFKEFDTFKGKLLPGK